ncbi:hypothetical protein C8J56DRAFT_1007166 [Mycena floridula]|nr:hypothetical protein C8J56DRAFT_1007166 [Mycena floridula]
MTLEHLTRPLSPTALKYSGLSLLLHRLQLSFKNSVELNKIIDSQLPTSRPRFQRQEIIIQGEVLELYYRDVLECIKSLFSNPEFAPYTKYTPEVHFKDIGKKVRLYHDMHTAKWWWETQAKIDAKSRGGTVIPIIISSDKTQVTVFRNKSAYPVYLTIGNIPKEIRRKPSCRAYILVRYLPTSRLLHITVKASRRRSMAHMFHACMNHILSSLKEPGKNGVILASGDGIRRRTHPIYATYVGDYPEQILVTCCTSGDCPQCEIPHLKVGEDDKTYPFRSLQKILDALSTIDRGPVAFIKACAEAGIKPIFDPFWEHLPHANPFASITPDILHQLLQGVLKHLKAWIIQAYGAAEIDARCRRLPPNHCVRIFMNGISTLSRVSGKEHGQIVKFLLALIVDIPLPNGVSSMPIVICLRSLLDFLHYAQYPVHSDATLAILDRSLKQFHANKHIFVQLGVRTKFRIPKLHFLSHYVALIRLFGTLDNFNTENTERLHIDMAKDAYRASNRKDEYPQMTLWLERKEKVMRHAKFIDLRKAGERPVEYAPSVSGVGFDEARELYGCSFFEAALCRFRAQLDDPSLQGQALERAVEGVHLQFARVSAFHRIKFVREDPFTHIVGTIDAIHAQPSRRDARRNHLIPGRFDTALIRVNDDRDVNSLRAYRVGRVRLAFSITQAKAAVFYNGVPAAKIPKHLAYIEWFSLFPARPEPNHLQYKISRSTLNGGPVASIIDLSRILSSIQLLPKFGPIAPREWTSSNVLDKCNTFFVSSFGSDDRFINGILAQGCH